MLPNLPTSLPKIPPPPFYIKNEESEMEMLLNEIPHVTSPQYHHHHHHHDDEHHHHRALASPLPSSSPHDMQRGHGHAHDSGDVAKLVDRLQSVYIGKESIGPFGLERNLGGLAPRIPTTTSAIQFHTMMAENTNLGYYSLSSMFPSKNHGFDPYFDSNALNLNLRSPTRSLSPVDGVVDGSLYGYLRDRLMGSRGSIYLLAKDQHGCRFLQEMFDAGKNCVDSIFDGVIAHIGELMKDQFGNYLMQKLFELCSDEQRTTILLVLTQDPATIFRISLDCHGTRAVQKLIETLETHRQIALVMAALRPGLLDLMKDINGNHVIQHCLTCLRTEETKFIFDAAAMHCVEIATHRHGCCVLQRCICCSAGELRANLVAKVTSNGLKLAEDAFGNYVVQYVIGLQSPSANASLASQFEGKFVQLSMQKFSSNVVEKCFKEFGEDFKAKIVREFLYMSRFEQLLQHPYANYVIQSALLNTKGASYSALVEAIRPHAAVLRTSPYCKRIFSLLSKKSGTF